MIGPAKMDAIDSRLDSLIRAMSSRGSIKHSLIITEENATLAIASCSHQGTEPSVDSIERTSLVVDGHGSADLRVEEIGGQIGASSISEALGIGRPFSCLAISGGRLLAGRDPLGQKP